MLQTVKWELKFPPEEGLSHKTLCTPSLRQSKILTTFFSAHVTYKFASLHTQCRYTYICNSCLKGNRSFCPIRTNLPSCYTGEDLRVTSRLVKNILPTQRRVGNNQRNVQAAVFEPTSWNSVCNYFPNISSLTGNKVENHLIWATCFYQGLPSNSVNQPMKTLSSFFFQNVMCLSTSILAAKT